MVNQVQAINGYLENGRFIPNEVIKLPKRVPAILIFNEIKIDNDKTERLLWLNNFYEAVKQAENEEMPDFPRADLKREFIELSDEG